MILQVLSSKVVAYWLIKIVLVLTELIMKTKVNANLIKDSRTSHFTQVTNSWHHRRHCFIISGILTSKTHLDLNALIHLIQLSRQGNQDTVILPGMGILIMDLTQSPLVGVQWLLNNLEIGAGLEASTSNTPLAVGSWYLCFRLLGPTHMNVEPQRKKNLQVDSCGFNAIQGCVVWKLWSQVKTQLPRRSVRAHSELSTLDTVPSHSSSDGLGEYPYRGCLLAFLDLLLKKC